jgi:hypothetical protein
MTDMEYRFRSLDRVQMPELWGEATLRAIAEPQAGPQTRPNYVLPAGPATAAIVIALIVGLGLLWGPTIGTPDASPSPSASQLPDLDMPGASREGGGFVAGEFGWTGALGSSTGMHSVVLEGDSAFRQTQMIFAIEGDCFADGSGPAPVPMTVAGLDGSYVEPYQDPGVLFMSPRGGETTGAYALPIDGRTLCVYLTWDPSTTPAELEAARQVIESIRGQAYGENGIRIVFTLPEGWDTG